MGSLPHTLIVQSERAFARRSAKVVSDFSRRDVIGRERVAFLGDVSLVRYPVSPSFGLTD